MSEQFCLRWNNHQSTLISVFETLLESGSLIDCTLCAEGQLLKGHKVVLSACSPIFESMLCIQEDKHPIIFLKDVKFIELKAMLDYMYKGEVNILQDQLDSFLRTAAALQIKGLTDQGGGGGDEPPAKKGPGRKTGMSDAPESPLVGNAPLREGSVSPTRRRRRLPRRPSSAEDASADNCDIPPPAVAPPAITPATQAPLPVVESLQRSSLTVKAKQEPIDTPLVTPKQEFVEETNEEIEDLTLDDDDDYNDSMSDLSKPGTSYGAMNPGSTSQQDFSQWQQMMGAADRSGTDEVFMAAQEAINNQANTQDHQQVQVSDEDNSRQDEAIDAPPITRAEVTEILNKIIKLENEVENEKVSFSNNESELEVELDSENKATALSDKELERIFGPPKDVNPTIESVEFVSGKPSKPDVKTTDVWPRLKKLLTDDKFEAVGSGAEVTSQPSTTTSTFESITKRSINVVPTYTLQEPKVCHRTVSMPVSLPVHFENSPVSRPPPPLSKIRKSKVPKQPKGSVVVKKTTSFKAILPKPTKSDSSSSAKNVQSTPRSLITPSPSKIHVSPSINPSSTSLCPLNKITVSSSPGQSNFTSSQIYLGPTVNPTDLPSPFTPVYANPSTYPTPSISSINSPQIFLTRTMNTASISRSAANTIPLGPNVPSLPSSSAVSPVRNVTKTTQSPIPNSQTPIVSPIPLMESKIYLDKPIITSAKVRKRTIQIVGKPRPPWSRI